MTPFNRANLKAKISKSKVIVQNHHINRTILERQNLIDDFRHKILAQKNDIFKNKIAATEKQMQTHPASITAEQKALYHLSLEHCKKIDTVTDATLILKVRANELILKQTHSEAAHKIHTGMSIITHIIDTLNHIYSTKADILISEQVANHLNNHLKLTKQEKKFLVDITKDNQKLTRAAILERLAKDRELCNSYVAKAEGVLLKRYKEYYEDIIGENIEKRVSVHTKKQEAALKIKKQNKAYVSIAKYLDKHFTNDAEALKSLLKEPIALLDKQDEASDYWDHQDNILKFLALITHEKFKYHFKTVVNTRFDEMRDILAGATKDSDKKSTAETQSSAVKAVLQEYGFSRTIDPMQLVKIVDPLFKGKEALRSRLATHLGTKSAPVTEPVAAVKTEASMATPTADTSLVTTITVTPANNLPAASITTCGLFANKHKIAEPESALLITRLLEKLRGKRSALVSEQLDPATSPQLKKYHSAYVVSLQETIAGIEACKKDPVKTCDLVSAEIHSKYHVNVVLRNILEAFVKKCRALICDSPATLAKFEHTK